MRYILSPQAQRDLEEIWDYTSTQWGLAQAETYIRGFQTAIETVAENPKRGRPCDEIRPGYFKFSVGSHILFYRLTVDALDVVRILHARMDFDNHL